MKSAPHIWLLRSAGIGEGAGNPVVLGLDEDALSWAFLGGFDDRIH